MKNTIFSFSIKNEGTQVWMNWGKHASVCLNNLCAERPGIAGANMRQAIQDFLDENTKPTPPGKDET